MAINRIGTIGTISAIKRIIADGGLTDSQKVTAIDRTLSAQAHIASQVEQQIDTFKESMAAIHRGQDYYVLLEQGSIAASRSNSLNQRLRSLGRPGGKGRGAGLGAAEWVHMPGER